MELQYKPDFPQVLERFEAWWRCEIVDRPPVSISVKRTKPPAELPGKAHASLRDRWLDVEHALDRFEAGLQGRVFFAESLPSFMPNVGPEVCATVFGCELEFGENTSWSIPNCKSVREVLGIEPSLDNPYWDAVRRGTQLSAERGAGKWLTAITDLHTNGDLLASLRDPQELCLDCADDLEGVRLACDHVTRAYPLMYEDLYDRTAGQPSLTWIPCPHAGKMYVTNCDFICMISPQMLEDSIWPSILREMHYLDRNIFHLDGPGALMHLDRLLAADELHGLQWVYGAGNEPISRWIDVYKRAQAAGKCLQLTCENMDEAWKLTEVLQPEGCWFCVGGDYTRAEAEAFVADIAKWAAGARR